MPEINWLQLVASLLGGGAAGAVITAVVSALRAQRQPVGEIGNKTSGDMGYTLWRLTLPYPSSMRMSRS